MARKKKEPEQNKKKVNTDGIMGLVGSTTEQAISETLEINYMPYAMSVIVSRAIPEIDGFKPSHRKLLYTMYKMGLLTGGRTKSANIVGQTMRLNPHGDAAIYETMVRLAKGNETLLHPFVDSKGNFGKVYSRDMAYAAARYTEAKLDPICAELSNFDIDNLRWNKVVICTDADVDGFQIRTLILTMLYRLCPTLIRDGYVYIAESPLFEITCKDKTWFAYNEQEKVKILKSLEGKKVTIQRSKGLGENDPEMMWMTTMNPETRRLIKVMPEDAERTAHYFDVLLGDALNERKNFIAENGAKYLELADIS